MNERAEVETTRVSCRFCAAYVEVATRGMGDLKPKIAKALGWMEYEYESQGRWVCLECTPELKAAIKLSAFEEKNR
jgi:hypothetical protein